MLARSCFHLDEGQRSPTSRYDVHFAARHACTSREDAPAPQAQVPARQRLGAAAAFFR
jgi:hypothetical protein